MARGTFIVFEGLDGSGQSTQVSLLADRLKRDGHKVHVTKEPTNNLVGGLIRGALTKEWRPSNRVIQLLYAADRGHHLEREILPALDKGHVVISDRYYWSSMAFGSLDLELPWLKELNKHFPAPDYVFYIKVRPEVAVRRIHSNRFEIELFEETKKLSVIAKTYDALVRQYPSLHSINGERPINDIHEEIFRLCCDDALHYCPTKKSVTA